MKEIMKEIPLEGAIKRYLQSMTNDYNGWYLQAFAKKCINTDEFTTSFTMPIPENVKFITNLFDIQQGSINQFNYDLEKGCSIEINADEWEFVGNPKGFQDKGWYKK
jgi:hypothetical protein